MATGVLPLFLGRATKACDMLPCQDKRYLAEFKLGITTDTLDITGEVTEERPVTVTEKQVREAAVVFSGDIMQVPPMYSAVKVGGKRLYDLARKGQEVERKARPVTIYKLDFLSYDAQAKIARIDVHCSKGTYIRTLVDDIGERLGCGAALCGLRRTMAAGFLIGQCLTIEQAQQQAEDKTLAVMPVQKAFEGLPKVILRENQARMFLNGIRLDCAKTGQTPQAETVGVYMENGLFLGVARPIHGQLHMLKLFTLREELV